MWQDVVLAIGSIIFSIALLPSVRGGSKPDWKTSLMTGSVLAMYVVVFASLGLLWSSITTAITAGLWFVLLKQARSVATS